jgi:prefoldin subunit 5
MIDKITIVIFMSLFFFNYVPPTYYNWFQYFNFKNIFINLNTTLYPEYWSEYLKNESECDDSDIVNCSNNNLELEPLPKYEDKYLDNIRGLNKEWIFTIDEQNKIIELTEKFFNGSINNMNLRLKQINEEINELDKEIYDEITIKNDSESDFESQSESESEYESENKYQCEYIQEKIENLKKEYQQINNHFNSLEESVNNLKNDSKNKATNYIINCRLDKLKNSYIIEKTPLGNVLMIYDKDCCSFKYYTDSTIPYRYLEPVGRKYVKFFNCRPIFVDMEEEFKLFEEKWEKEKELKKQKAEEKEKDTNINIKKNECKKNVFAKFKSYNKDAGGKISMAPPKNSISKQVSENKENDTILLKERANRYTYEGKFANFNFLQKIERKVFNKKLRLSFAEFKNLSK